MIKEIINAVTIPVMAKVRIGHFVEAQVSPIYIIIAMISGNHINGHNFCTLI